MGSSLTLKNDIETEFTIEHTDGSYPKSIAGKDIAIAVDTINDFPLNPQNGDVVIVRDLDIGGTFIYDSTEAVNSNCGTNFNGWVRQYSGAVNVKWFGAKGDGVTDDTLAIQNAINDSKNGILILDGDKTYLYSSLTISDVNIITNGAKFKHTVASTTSITIGSNVSIDYLNIECIGGDSADRAVHFTSSNNVRIGVANINALSMGVYNKISYAIDIDVATNVHIGELNTNNFSTALFAKTVDNLSIDKGTTKYYKTAYYLRDVSNSTIENIVCAYTSTASNGSAGENGLLIESSVANGTYNLHFNNWNVRDSGEHAYRLGGQLTIKDVWFTDCRSVRSGSAIVVNNPSATEWHGGCGFKVLGASSVTGQKHKNIHFTNCIVEDINETYGSFPAGHGANNFSGFLIAVADNVTIDNCSVRSVQNTYSCASEILIVASDNVFVNNFNGKDSYMTPLYLLQEATGYAGWDLPSTNIHINSSFFETANSGLGYIFYSDNKLYAHSGIYMRDCVLSGASHAVRFEPVTTGSYDNVSLHFKYINCTTNPATATEPVVYGGNYALLDIEAPWHSSAYSPSSLNGSKLVDTYGGTIRQKIAGSWQSVNVTSGQYNPTLTNVTNIDASAVLTSFNYSRNGNIVTVSGMLTVDNTTANALSELGISLPIASNFTSYANVAGTAAAWTPSSLCAVIKGDTTNHRAVMAWQATSTTDNRTWAVHFSYPIV